jgi:Zn finger protein HypA/HybF involved in hydrogenase expression
VDLEERTIESLPARCENCGAELTDAEKQRILDEGATLALCTTCAAEQEPVVEGDEFAGDESY